MTQLCRLKVKVTLQGHWIRDSVRDLAVLQTTFLLHIPMFLRAKYIILALVFDETFIEPFDTYIALNG